MAPTEVPANCPKCSAPIDSPAARCAFCGTRLVDSGDAPDELRKHCQAFLEGKEKALSDASGKLVYLTGCTIVVLPIAALVLTRYYGGGWLMAILLAGLGGLGGLIALGMALEAAQEKLFRTEMARQIRGFQDEVGLGGTELQALAKEVLKPGSVLLKYLGRL